MRPLESGALERHRCSGFLAAHKVKDSTYSGKNGCGQNAARSVHPQLLLRRAKSNPNDVRLCGVYRSHRTINVRCIPGSKRRRIRSGYRNPRKPRTQRGSEVGKCLLGASEEEVTIQAKFSATKGGEKVASSNALRRALTQTAEGPSNWCAIS
jgi:hypothetical protein